MTSDGSVNSGVALDHDALMARALVQARLAADKGDVPVGALVVWGGEIVAERHNERELTGDPTAHAEILALRDAAKHLGTWRLGGCTLVATLEPCVMCGGALVAARLDRVVYGAADIEAGACLSAYNVCADPRLNHELEVVSGIRAAECGELLSQYFADRRSPTSPAA